MCCQRIEFFFSSKRKSLFCSERINYILKLSAHQAILFGTGLFECEKPPKKAMYVQAKCDSFETLKRCSAVAFFLSLFHFWMKRIRICSICAHFVCKYVLCTDFCCYFVFFCFSLVSFVVWRVRYIVMWWHKSDNLKLHFYKIKYL